MEDLAAPAPPGRESRGPNSDPVSAWVFFGAIVGGTVLLNAWLAPAEPAAEAAAGLEAAWQQRLADPAVQTAVGAAGLVFFLLFLAGLFTAYRAVAADAAGLLRPAFAAREQQQLGAERLPYFEVVSVFLLALILAGGLAGALAEKTGSQLPLLLNVVAGLALAWPLLRGKSPEELRLALGWHRGRGVLSEVLAGLRAYVTAWPLLAVGLALTALLSRFAGEQPVHPLVEWLEDPSPAGLATAAFLAVVWAPLGEESVFRGAFYAYLRGRLGKIGAGLAAGVTFAAIHPQGFAGIPFLTSLALALALTREWRGSIIAPVTLHAVHNGLAVAGLYLILRH